MSASEPKLNHKTSTSLANICPKTELLALFLSLKTPFCYRAGCEEGVLAGVGGFIEVALMKQNQNCKIAGCKINKVKDAANLRTAEGTTGG